MKTGMSAANIGRAGEKAVVDWLVADGFTIATWNTQTPGATDIEAVKNGLILVQVKSAVYPNVPATLSGAEVSSIRARATSKGADAWQARVLLRPDLSPRSPPEWTQL